MSAPPQFIEPTSGNSIENVLSYFRTYESYAQPNRYEVGIWSPVGGRSWPESNLISSVRGDAQVIALRCETVTLPGRNLSSTPDTNVHGPLREVVNNVNYADSVSMTFQASSDLRERVFFEKWQYTAFNPKTWNVGYYNDYIGIVDIYLLDNNNQRKYALRLHECFPKSIAQTDLSYASNNEIIKLSIEMNFRYWTSLDITQIVPRVPTPRPHAKVDDDWGGDESDEVHIRVIPKSVPSVVGLVDAADGGLRGRYAGTDLVDAADGGRKARGASGWDSSPF